MLCCSNGKRGDNRAVNLQWCTGEENRQHAYDMRLTSKWTQEQADFVQEIALLFLQEISANTKKIKDIKKLYRKKYGFVDKPNKMIEGIYRTMHMYHEILWYNKCSKIVTLCNVSSYIVLHYEIFWYNTVFYNKNILYLALLRMAYQ